MRPVAAELPEAKAFLTKNADHCRSTCSKPCNAREHPAAAATGQFNVTLVPW